MMPTKAIKLSIPIALADFPVDAIPRPGTPDGKGVVIEISVQAADGVTLSASLKSSGLQRLLSAIEAAPQGGFVVLQGKLAAGGAVAEAGVIFQPGKPEQPSQEAGQMPEHRGPSHGRTLKPLILPLGCRGPRQAVIC